jgi:hypothetical protein
MTPEQQNIAIAEWCGWKQIPDSDYPDEFVWVWEGQATESECEHPNYHADLNAVHEAEKKLTQDVFERYVDELISLIHEVEPGYFNKMTWPMAGELLTATAPQRCEALLKTLNLWREE